MDEENKPLNNTKPLSQYNSNYQNHSPISSQQINTIIYPSGPSNRYIHRTQGDTTHASPKTSSTQNPISQWLSDINMYKCKQTFFIIYMAIFETSFAITFWSFFSSGQNFQYLLIWPLIDNIFNYIVLGYLSHKHLYEKSSYTKPLYFELTKSCIIGIAFYIAFTDQRSW